MFNFDRKWITCKWKEMEDRSHLREPFWSPCSFFNRAVIILGQSLAIVVKPLNVTTALPTLTLEEEKYHSALMSNDEASEYNAQFKASQLC